MRPCHAHSLAAPRPVVTDGTRARLRVRPDVRGALSRALAGGPLDHQHRLGQAARPPQGGRMAREHAARDGSPPGVTSRWQGWAGGGMGRFRISLAVVYAADSTTNLKNVTEMLYGVRLGAGEG
eukprot:2396132-Prymnesium_polylepis.1